MPPTGERYPTDYRMTRLHRARLYSCSGCRSGARPEGCDLLGHVSASPSDSARSVVCASTWLGTWWSPPAPYPPQPCVERAPPTCSQLHDDAPTEAQAHEIDLTSADLVQYSHQVCGEVGHVHRLVHHIRLSHAAVIKGEDAMRLAEVPDLQRGSLSTAEAAHKDDERRSAGPSV